MNAFILLKVDKIADGVLTWLLVFSEIKLTFARWGSSNISLPVFWGTSNATRKFFKNTYVYPEVESATGESGITCWHLKCPNTLLCLRSLALYPWLNKHSLKQNSMTVAAGFGVGHGFEYVWGLFGQSQKATKIPRCLLLFSLFVSLTGDRGERISSMAGGVFIPRQSVWSAQRQSMVTGLCGYNALHCSSFPSRTISPASCKIQASVLWDLDIINTSLSHSHSLALHQVFLRETTTYYWGADVSLLLTRFYHRPNCCAVLWLSSSPCHQQLCSWGHNSVETSRLPFHCQRHCLSDLPQKPRAPSSLASALTFLLSTSPFLQ